MALLVVAQFVANGLFAAPVKGAKNTKEERSIFYRDKLLLTYSAAVGNTITISDPAGNTLWVAQREQIKEVYAKILPRELERLYKKTHHLQTIGDHLAAIQGLERLLELFPNSPYTYYLLGRSHAEGGDRNAAMQAFEQALKSFTTDIESRSELSILHFYAGNFPAAIKGFRQALTAVKKMLPSDGALEDKKLRVPEHFSNSRDYKAFLYDLSDRKELIAQNLVLAYGRQADRLYEKGDQKGALRQLELAMQLLPQKSGLLETYRHYAVYSPTTKTKKRKPKELEIWLEQVKRHNDAGRKQQALALLGHLKTIYPQAKKITTTLSKLNLELAAELEGWRKLAFLVTAFEKDNGQLPVAKQIEKTLQTILNNENRQIHVEDLVRVAQRYQKAATTDNATLLLADVYTTQAESLLRQKELNPAKAVIEKAWKIAPENDKVKELRSQVHVTLAETYQKQGDLPASINSYNEAIRSGRGGPWLHLKLGGLRLQQFWQQHYLLTLLLLGGLLSLLMLTRMTTQRLAQKREIRQDRKQGWQAYKQQQWDMAVQHLARYVKRSRTAVQFPVYQALAESYVKLEDFDSALAVYRKIAYLFPQSPCYLDEAKIYIRQGRVPLLQSCLQRSNHLEEDCSSLIDHCFNLMEKGDDQKSLQEIIGSLYLLTKDIERAKYIFTQVITHHKNEDLRYTYKQLIEIAKRQKENDSLKKILDRYEKAYPEEPFAHIELGNYYENQGEDKTALQHFTHACKIAYSEQLENKIQSLQHKRAQQKLDEELAKLDKKPPTPATRLRIAALKLQTGDYVGCIEDCSALIQEGQGMNEAMRLLGHAYYSRENFAQAAECLEKFLKLAPDESSEAVKEARYRLGNAYLKQGLLESAVQEFRRLHDTDPRYRDVDDKVHLRVTACPYCSKEITTDTTTCPHCQAKIRDASMNAADIMIGDKQFVSTAETTDPPVELMDDEQESLN